MAALIKNQIIKRLSKFVKNLASNQINLSTLKGEGELSSINLDETALEDVIELPTWLKIQKATCGRVFIKIPWTSLKTLPIQLQLDDVIIEIETCEQLRHLHGSETPSAPGSDPLAGKYGFTNRVIDGISLTITNLTFQIKAHGFKASIFLPSLDIYSTTPDGKQVDTLTFTRLRNSTKDHILLFKEISWPNARIEASANDGDSPGTAIRLIVNSCRVRIAMKKNLQDSTMVASRLQVHFDDLLSVVNDAQLKSALNTYKEITLLMKRASEQRKHVVGDKLTRLERQQQPSSVPPKIPTAGPNDRKSSVGPQTAPTDVFTRFDIPETSLHFNVKRLDLHILSDSDVQTDRLVENGSIQMTIANISMDHYPYHEFGSSKKHWINYNELQSTARNDWIGKLHADWHEQFNTAKSSVPSDDLSTKFEKALRSNRIRLFASYTALNIDDFVLYPVSLNQDKQQKRRRPLITSDKTFFQLPDSLGIINVQHTEYYYPLPYSFPVPNSDLYIQIMPIVLRIDFATLGWLDAFVSTLSLTIDKSGILQSDGHSSDLEHTAILMEAMLPRIVLSSDTFSSARELQHSETVNQHRLNILELNVSKFLMTNVRTEPTSSRSRLEQHLDLFKATNFFENAAGRHMSPLFTKHSYDTYLYANPLSSKTSQLPEPPSSSRALHTYYTMTTDSLKKSAKYDIWHFYAERIYLDFTPASPSESNRSAKQNMTDTMSISGWTVLDEKQQDSAMAPWANILCVLDIPSMVRVSQKQYTFVMRLVDELGLFLDVLERNKIQSSLIQKRISPNRTAKEFKTTIYLTAPTALTLAVIDGLEETVLSSLTVPSALLPEAEKEPALRDTSDSTVVIDLIAATAPIVASTAKVEPSASMNISHKASPLSGPRKSRVEENSSRGSDFSSQVSILSSSVAMSDHSDDTASQWDLSEDLDADLDATLFYNDVEQPQKPTRIELDEDSWSLTGKNAVAITPLESFNGVFVKLNQLHVCITEDEEKSDKPMFIACGVKYLRIDEFISLKFDAIKPKLFAHEKPDPLNDANVPPIQIRIDFLKGETSSSPTITVQMQDRSLPVSTHALELLLQNLEEIPECEEGMAIRKDQPKKLVPIDVDLRNVQFTLELPQKSDTTHAVIDPKPPMNVTIAHMHVRREHDGHVRIEEASPRDHRNRVVRSDAESSKELCEKLRQSDLLQLENDRLRAELSAYRSEIEVLGGERDSLMNTISKLDVELTRAEHQNVAEQQAKKSRKK